MAGFRISASSVLMMMCLVALEFFGVARLAAQTAGNNTVWKASGTGGVVVAPSSAFIDASVLSGGDICAKITTALNAIPSAATGAVIDARGFTANPLGCLTNPWGGVSNPKPAVVLLPATTIQMSATWVLPDRTRLVGEGMRDNGTVLQASGAVSPMIQFGPCASTCAGIGVQDIFLDGTTQAITGIENDYGGDLSYVDHVNLANFGSDSQLGIGLKVTAADSGPYSNLSCGSTKRSTECIDLAASNTKGIHGVTCTDRAPSAYPAILLDGSNNTLENIHIEGFDEGILVGSVNAAQSNTLLNINGTSGAGDIANLIHLSSLNTLTDMAILTAAAQNVNGGLVTNLLQDDVTSTTIANSGGVLGTPLAKYVLGGLDASGGYSRFTSDTVTATTPTFGVGTGTVSGTCNPIGAIYVNISGTSGGNNTLFVCKSNGVWGAVK